MLRLSTTNKIGGSFIYNPKKGAKETIAPILDSNSGLTDSGEYKFTVVKTRKNIEITYDTMTQSELTYMLNLLYDSSYQPKEVLYSGLFKGVSTSFYVYSASNAVWEIEKQGEVYKNVTFSLSETRAV